MFAKVTVSLPEELLVAIDAEAAECGRSRSSVVQEAAETYLAARSQATEEKQRQGLAAIAEMRRIAARPKVRDPRPSIEIVRELRENHGFATPLAGERQGR